MEDTKLKCTECGEEEADGWTYDADLADDVYWSITIGDDGLCTDCANERMDAELERAEWFALAGE